MQEIIIHVLLVLENYFAGDKKIMDSSETEQTLSTKNPTRIANKSDWTLFLSGGYHTCGIRNNNTELSCWGSNDYGQFGDGTNTMIKIFLYV